MLAPFSFFMVLNEKGGNQYDDIRTLAAVMHADLDCDQDGRVLGSCAGMTNEQWESANMLAPFSFFMPLNERR